MNWFQIRLRIYITVSLTLSNAYIASTTSIDVKLSISVRDLIRPDKEHNLDPICVTYNQQFGQWKEYQRTKIMQNGQNPDFINKVVMSYKFKEHQLLMFEIYNMISRGSDQKEKEFIGFAVCSLGQIISNTKIQLQLLKKSDSGQIQPTEIYIFVRADELEGVNDQVFLQLTASSLDRKNLLGYGKSNPFLEIYKFVSGSEYALVYRTEVINNALNVRWERFSISVRTLCDGDYNRKLKFVCRSDGDWSRGPSLIGQFETTLAEMSRDTKQFSLHILDHNKKPKNSGNLHIEYLEIKKEPTLVEYLKGGLQIHGAVAIDFSATNGASEQLGSFHHLRESPSYMNYYEQAIDAVFSTIEHYESNKLFTVLGFGARLPPNNSVSQNFNVDRKSNSPFCVGVTGVLTAYRQCLGQIHMNLPIKFAPVIQRTAELVRTFNHSENYFILMIITNGINQDIPETIQAIVDASELPLYIIVVGIGYTDFKRMKYLHDFRLKRNYGSQMNHNMVKIVSFSNFMWGGVSQRAKWRLSEAILTDVPQRILSYMKSHNFTPKSRDPESVSNPEDLPLAFVSK